jgi:hypothetical protein
VTSEPGLERFQDLVPASWASMKEENLLARVVADPLRPDREGGLRCPDRDPADAGEILPVDAGSEVLAERGHRHRSASRNRPATYCFSYTRVLVAVFPEASVLLSLIVRLFPSLL